MTATTLETESIGIIGGGISGLATASLLANAGADVTLYEQQEQLGGVATQISQDGFQFDAGPSWYLMPDVFERFFAHFDETPEQYYSLRQLDPNYQVFWKDGDTAIVPADRAGQRALFESYEAGAGEKLETYLEEAKEAYHIGMEEFVYEHRPRLRHWIDPSLLKTARGVTLLGSMDEHVSGYFESTKLQQLLQYTLVFLGGSPYNTPALYSLMSHVDYNMGVYYPEGGIASVVNGLVRLAHNQGVTIRTATGVQSIQTVSNGIQFETEKGTPQFDRGVSAAPPAYTERELLATGVRDHRESYWENRTYAPSAFLLYLGVEGEIETLDHHSLVLPTDWEPHFNSIFDEKQWPENPSYYLNVPTATDDTVAPDGYSTLVILVPIAPGLPDNEAQRQQFRSRVFDDIAAYTGVDLRDRIVFQEEACISEFAAMGYPDGTALGLAHTLRQTGPFRPDHRSTAVPSLYYVGSFTNPGIGMPMCLISAEHVTQAIKNDVDSDRSSRFSRLNPMKARN